MLSNAMSCVWFVSISNLFDTFLLYFLFVGKVVASVSHHFKNKSNTSPPKKRIPHHQNQQDTHPHTQNQISILFLETLPQNNKNPGENLLNRQILYNNLGGLGPGHLDEPALLRFEKTCSIDDRAVDLVTWCPIESGGIWGSSNHGAQVVGDDPQLTEVRKEIPVFLRLEIIIGIKNRKWHRLFEDERIPVDFKKLLSVTWGWHKVGLEPSDKWGEMGPL